MLQQHEQALGTSERLETHHLSCKCCCYRPNDAQAAWLMKVVGYGELNCSCAAAGYVAKPKHASKHCSIRITSSQKNNVSLKRTSSSCNS